MNDYEFAQKISKEIGELYSVAKSRLVDFPLYSLIHQRSIAEVVCNIIVNSTASEIDTRQTLDNKIAHFKKHNLINFQTAESLTALRKNGNIGAHPEKYSLSDAQKFEIAQSTIQDCLSLLEYSYQLLHGTASIPDYEVTEPTNDFLQTMTYKAMVEGDAESQYLAGRYFQGRAAKYDDDIRKAGGGFLGQEYQSYLDQAQLWFKLAHHQGHRESLYEYGMTLANGRDKSMIGMGQGCIARSAGMGYAEAQVQLGMYLRYGSNNFDIDLPDALYNFTEAAQLDHPAALAELAEMHANGLGTPLDMQKAFECSVRSAEAGYPQGQFYLAECYASGMGVEPNEDLAFEWLAKSAEQYHPEAMFALSNAIISGQTTAFPLENAKTYLNYCLNVPAIQNYAKVAYAKYLLEFEPGIEGMIVAALMFQECFENEEPNTELSKESSTLGRQTIQDIRKQLPKLGGFPELIEAVMVISAYYDEQGYPYKNRHERMSMVMELAKDYGDGKNISSHLTTLGIAQGHPKQGRNEPCACGSSKKFKQCHGR